MQRNINSKHPVKATIKSLPTINLNLSDESCIYSTLLFVEQQAQQLNFLSLSITFDQPLFIKAFKILKAKDTNTVIRLGDSSPNVLPWWNWNWKAVDYPNQQKRFSNRIALPIC